MSVVKREVLSRGSSPLQLPPSPLTAPPTTAESPPPPLPPAPPQTLPRPGLSVPSFVQLPDGGLFAQSSVPPGIVFGPYKGSVQRAPPKLSRDAEQTTKSTSLKFHSSAGQEYTVEVDKTETGHPWWVCIPQTAEQRQANIALFSCNGGLYLRTLEQIPKGKELTMHLTTPGDKEDTPEGGSTDVTSPARKTAQRAETATQPHPSESSVMESPPFKCNYCCIEFRNPSNLDAHRVYYCPGTATKPLPCSRRRPAAPTSQSGAAPDASVAVVSTPPARTTTTTTTKAPDAAKAAAGEAPKTFVCQLCQSSFESRSNCESHMLLLHCDESANLCKFCNFISGDRQGLCQHVFSHVRGTRQEATIALAGENGDPGLKFPAKNTAGDRVAADQGDEKENRYSSKVWTNGTQPEPSPGTGGTPSSLCDRENRPVSMLPSPETTAFLSRDETRSPAEAIKTESPNGVSAGLSRDQDRDDILTCGCCEFATSRESVLQKHATHHDHHLPRKAHDRSADAQVPKKDTPAADHADTTCHQCNIVFMSKRNYAAHKQYYCASRHADSTSPPSPPTWGDQTGKPSSQGNDSSRTLAPEGRVVTRKPFSGSSKTRDPCPLKVVSPRCSPFGESRPVDSSPRNGARHSASHSSGASPGHLASPNSGSSPDRPGLDRPLPMIHLDGKPQILAPGAVLPGQQLVLVTPIVIPQGLSTAAKLAGNLKIPVVRPGQTEQPLDLSTKPKTPPLSDPSDTRSHRPNAITPERLSRTTSPQLLERPSNRCEECEISFSKKESLLVHKQFYCASRHMYSPRTQVRTKLCDASRQPAASKSKPQRKSPSPVTLAQRSPNSAHGTGNIETRSSPTKANVSNHVGSPQAFSNSSTGGSLDVTSSPSTHSTVSKTTSMILLNGNSTHDRADTAIRCNPNPSWCRTRPSKRLTSAQTSEWDSERSLPPIKRKKHLILDGDSRQTPTGTASNGILTNGGVVKREPESTDGVSAREGCSNGESKTEANYAPTQQHPRNTSRTSTPSPAPHPNTPTALHKGVRVKQEPQEDIPASNGSGESPQDLVPNSCPSSRLPRRQQSTGGPAHRPDLSRQPLPPRVRHPVVPPSPLAVPVFRHGSPRQASPSRHVTVSSYLNTGTSRPLLRGVKPTVKHCRNCNISFSSLSTFIAHKKYYCASHHQAKSAAS